MATRASFTAALLAAADIPGGGRVLVDLNDVTFFGADGTAALTQAHAAAAASGTDVYIAAAADTPAGRVLNRIRGLHDGDGHASGQTRRTVDPNRRPRLEETD